LENKEHKSLQGYEHFVTFVNRWEKKCPVLRKYKAQRNIAYFIYMDIPVEVQRCIYTTNWIERLSRKYKRTIKMRAAMPSSQSVLFLLAYLLQWKKCRLHIEGKSTNGDAGKRVNNFEQNGRYGYL